MKPRAVVCLCLLAAGGAMARPAPSAAEQPESGGLPLGYTPAAWDQGLLIEEQYASLLDRARISRTHEVLTREPHRAGTEGARRVAAYIKQEADRAGFHAEIVPYLFYNSHPGPRSIELTAPLQARLSLVEDRIPGDPFTEHAADHQAFCAYSGSGAVEAEVVYVGQGTVRDFKTLEDNGISLKGRVALMRYFGEWEGRKVLRAQERGAAGAILYADPQEDGFIQGPVYPRGAWRPPGSIMRRPESLDYRFKVQNKGSVVDASYTGVVPDTFKDDSEVVLKGRLTDQGFHTGPNGVTAKCPSKYEAAKKVG